MLRRAGRAMATRLRDESGVTLIELLASMIAGAAVITAIVIVASLAVDQSTRINTKVDASEQAMVKLEQLENELHSACVVDGVTPIMAGSTGSSVNFVSYFGDAASPTPIWHNVVYSNGTLTDYSYSVQGTAPNYTQGTLLNTNTLLTNVAQNGSTPIFQYFAYQEVSNGSGGYYSDGAGNPYEMLVDGTTAVPGTSTIPPANPLSTPLTSSSVLTTAEIMINLLVGPTGGTGEITSLSDANIPITDSVVFRLTPPANHVETGATFEPCD